MTSEKLWLEFCKIKNIDADTPYEAWAFCGGGPEADELAKLVVEGKKFGTASAYDEYAYENALVEIPKAGDYSIILDSKDEAVCVIRDYDVYIREFDKVTPFHAYSEGEGDRSLLYWRNVHRDFFKESLDEIGLKLSQESLIICEKFTVEYIAGDDKELSDEIIFVEPSVDFADEITSYREEMLKADSSFDGCFSMKRMPDVKEYVNHCIEWSDPSRTSDEHGAWGNVLMCLRKSDMKMVGCMQIHNVLTERMEKYTGHVGYSVRPSERRKGYATLMLSKALDFLKSFGFKEVFAACLTDNDYSRKTILANGGSYVETVYLEEDKVYLERYCFKL